MKTNRRPSLKGARTKLNDESLLAELNKRLLGNPRGKGVPAEKMPKLIEGWIRDAKKKKRVRQ